MTPLQTNRIRRAARLLVAATVFAVVAAPRLSAQRELFGMSGSGASEVRRQFEAEARQQVSALLLDYESAWGSRNLAGLVKLYGPGATLYPAGSGTLAGRDAIRGYFQALLPRVGPLRTQMMEFRVSGDLAFTTLQVRYAEGEGASAHTVAATDVVVLRRSVVGAWSIVSHLTRPEPVAPADSAR